MCCCRMSFCFKSPSSPPSSSQQSPTETTNKSLRSRLFQRKPKPPKLSSTEFSRQTSSKDKLMKQSSSSSTQQLIRNLFSAVDIDSDGYIGPVELHSALSRGDWPKFDFTTTQSLMQIFTSDTNTPTAVKRIHYEDFCELWSTIENWHNSFKIADSDKSGLVDISECQNILRAYGFVLSNEFVRFMFGKYAKENSRKLDFDAYCNLIAGLLVATNIFKKIDQTKTGIAKIDFSTFMLSVLTVTRKLKATPSANTQPN